MTSLLGRLNDRLHARRVAAETRELREAYDEFLSRLTAAQVGAQAKAPGDRMPAFILPDTMGRLVDSADLLATGPLVVTFVRGNWCPYCVMTLTALQDRLADIEAAGATLVTLTPETGGLARQTQEAHDLSYRLLVDVDLAVGMEFGIVFKMPPLYTSLLRRGGIDLAARSGNDSWFLPIPATFLVDSGGIIRRSWVDIDFTRRAEPDEIVDALRSMR